MLAPFQTRSLENVHPMGSGLSPAFPRTYNAAGDPPVSHIHMSNRNLLSVHVRAVYQAETGSNIYTPWPCGLQHINTAWALINRRSLDIILGVFYVCGISFLPVVMWEMSSTHPLAPHESSRGSPTVFWAHLDILWSFYEGAGRRNSLERPDIWVLTSRYSPSVRTSGDALHSSSPEVQPLSCKTEKASGSIKGWLTVIAIPTFHSLLRNFM